MDAPQDVAQLRRLSATSERLALAMHQPDVVDIFTALAAEYAAQAAALADEALASAA